MFGRDTYWSIDTSDPNQLTITVLPVTLKNLIDSKKITDHYVEIRYALQLDDAAAWNERTLEEKTYTNTATWDGASTSSGMTITRPEKKLLEKTGNYDVKTHQANYTLCINPAQRISHRAVTRSSLRTRWKANTSAKPAWS